VSLTEDHNNPKGAYDETCFYSADKSMPKAEQIATALLQLKNNPSLFDRWAAQSGAFRADGQAFSPAQQSTCDENANQMRARPARRRVVFRRKSIRPHAAISSSQYSWRSPPRTSCALIRQSAGNSCRRILGRGRGLLPE